ncbi:MAG TPA: hypothetical protein VES79_07320 [Solirubrobacteraceae bacterium]|nr:hypothetical protein [Solirubrobacteraceae bacterium]
MARLDGKRIAFLVANEGVEQVELTEPWEADASEYDGLVLPGGVANPDHLFCESPHEAQSRSFGAGAADGS